MDLYDGYQDPRMVEIRKLTGTKTLVAGNTLMTIHTANDDFSVNIDYPRDKLKTISDELHKYPVKNIKIYNDPQYSGQIMAPKWKGKIKDNGPYGVQSFKVDLSQTEDELWVGMHKSHRNAVRLAEKAGCIFASIDKTNEAAFQRFFSIYTTLGQVKRFKTVSDEGLHAIYNGGMAQIYFVIHKLVVPPLATAFILHSHGKVSRYQFGAGPKEYYKYHPSNYLHWKIMLDCKAKGQLWYDMGGASNDNIFKRHFGGKLFPQEGLTWDKTMGEWFI